MAWRGKPGAWVGVYCPNGERLALVGEDGHVRILDAKSTRESGANRPPNSVTPLLPALGDLPGNLDEKIAEAVGDDTGAEGSSEHIDVAR